MPRGLRLVIVALVAALSVGFFFRTQLLNYFSVLFGDRYDGVIIVALEEHWYNVFRGLARWNVTGYFYPHKDTLGYNDGLLLYGMVYSCFRSLGSDLFLSSELTNVVIKLVGFLGFFAVARRVLAVGFWPAVLGSALFVIANNSFVQADHVQLLSVGLAPLMMLLSYEAAIALYFGQRMRGTGWGLGAAAFYASWLLTSFYMSWFFGLFCIAMAAVGTVSAGTRNCAIALRIGRREILPLGIIAVGFAIFLVPFLKVYLPIAAQSGMHPFGDVMLYSP
ncbi:MAG: hypothetical protein WCB49_11480, partial [Gammaproteobacteria bacterium]